MPRRPPVGMARRMQVSIVFVALLTVREGGTAGPRWRGGERRRFGEPLWRSS